MKIYFGKHSTNNILDGYIASGIKINRYIKKYPKDFYKYIISFYSNEYELNNAEYKLIHNHLNQPYCLNLMEGGHGGATGIEGRKKISEKVSGKNHPFYGKHTWMYGKKHTEEAKRQNTLKQIGNQNKKNKKLSTEQKTHISNVMKEYYKTHPISEETKQKCSAKLSGENNPMYGKNVEDYMTPEAIQERRRNISKYFKNTKWINNEKECIRIKINDLQKYLEQGYVLGRLKNEKTK